MRVFVHASAVGIVTIRPAKLAINSDITAQADDGGFAVLGHGERREGA
jgi:ethanolamine utilization microcompartment shell protein EutS